MMHQTFSNQVDNKLVENGHERESVNLNLNRIPYFIMMKKSNTVKKASTKGHLFISSITKRKTASQQRLRPLIDNHSPSKLQTTKKINLQTDNSNLSSQLEVIPKITQFRSSSRRTKTLNDQHFLFHEQMCRNHPSKKAHYIFQTSQQSDATHYCKKCAAQLASQGFAVILLQSASKRPKLKKSSMLLNGEGQMTFSQENSKMMYPNFQKKSLMKQLKQLLRQVSQSKQSHLQTVRKIDRIETIYKDQIEIIDNFYLGIIQAFENYREEHVNGLQNEWKLLVSDFERQQLYLKRSIKQFDNIQSDIKKKISQSSKESIQNKVGSFVSYYKHVLSTLQQRQQNVNNSLIHFPEYKSQQLQRAIKTIEGSIQLIQTGIHSRSVHSCIKPINIKIKNLHCRRTIENHQFLRPLDIIPISYSNRGLEKTRKNKNEFVNQGRILISKQKFFDRCRQSHKKLIDEQGFFDISNTQSKKNSSENSQQIAFYKKEQPIQTNKLNKCQSKKSLASSYELLDDTIKENVDHESPQFKSI